MLVTADDNDNSMILWRMDRHNGKYRFRNGKMYLGIKNNKLEMIDGGTALQKVNEEELSSKIQTALHDQREAKKQRKELKEDDRRFNEQADYEISENENRNTRRNASRPARMSRGINPIIPKGSRLIDEKDQIEQNTDKTVNISSTVRKIRKNKKGILANLIGEDSADGFEADNENKVSQLAPVSMWGSRSRNTGIGFEFELVPIFRDARVKGVVILKGDRCITSGLNIEMCELPDDALRAPSKLLWNIFYEEDTNMLNTLKKYIENEEKYRKKRRGTERINLFSCRERFKKTKICLEDTTTQEYDLLKCRQKCENERQPEREYTVPKQNVVMVENPVMEQRIVEQSVVAPRVVEQPVVTQRMVEQPVGWNEVNVKMMDGMVISDNSLLAGLTNIVSHG